MIPKEIIKRGGILSHLAQLEEESPYKPEVIDSHSIWGISHKIAHK
jgi:hypothetical protein